MNFNRFMNVARYNFAINRAQYTKLAFSLFLVMSLPLLIFILKTIWVFGVTHNTEWALASMPGASMGNWMTMCFVFAWPILAGYTFPSCLERREVPLPRTGDHRRCLPGLCSQLFLARYPAVPLCRHRLWFL